MRRRAAPFRRRQRLETWRGVLLVAVGASTAEMIAEVADIISDRFHDHDHSGSWFRLVIVAAFLVLLSVLLFIANHTLRRTAELALVVEVSRPGFDNRYRRAVDLLSARMRTLELPIRLDTPYETSPQAVGLIRTSVDNMLGTIGRAWPGHGLAVFVVGRPQDAYLVGSRLSTLFTKGTITLLQSGDLGEISLGDRLELYPRHTSFTGSPSMWDGVLAHDGPEKLPAGDPAVLDVILHGTVSAKSMPADVEAWGAAGNPLGGHRAVFCVDYAQLAERELESQLPRYLRTVAAGYVDANPEVRQVRLFLAATNSIVTALGYYHPVPGRTTTVMATVVDQAATPRYRYSPLPVDS